MTLDVRSLALRQLMEAALLRLLPAGGQQTARRNAWAGMSELSHRGRDREQAERALDAALAELLAQEVRALAVTR